MKVLEDAGVRIENFREVSVKRMLKWKRVFYSEDRIENDILDGLEFISCQIAELYNRNG